MQYTGKVHKVGAHIDTDAIIPARYLVTSDPEELGAHCMAGLEENWIERVHTGDILVGGPNFGCGSSREHAPLAILGAGIPVVVAHSFARIFYRNGFNMGLPLLEVGDAVERISDGDTLSVDVQQGTVTNTTTGEVIACPPVPEFMQELLAKGGLIPYVRDRLQASGA
ncbi:MAG: 3-isopropylmalate dehydratase small subunit [Desulfohalobium sp.]